MIFGIIVMVIMGLCFVGVIVGIVMIGKWSEEAMDQIMKHAETSKRIKEEHEEEKLKMRQSKKELAALKSIVRNQITNFK